MTSLDRLITQFLFDLIPHSSAANMFFMFFSAVGSFAALWIVLGILLIIFEEGKHREFIVFFLGGLLVTLLITEITIKPIVRRERPHTTLVEQPLDYSFPSTHAATSFFAATLLSFYHRRKWALFMILALLISFSRIYLSVHYFGDVFFGAIIGFIIALVAVNLEFEIKSFKLNHGICTITPKRGHPAKGKRRIKRR